MVLSVKGIALFALLGVPSGVLLISLLFGGILSAAEGWPFGQGFYFVANIITAACNPFTNDVPSTTAGWTLVAILSAWVLMTPL